MSEKEAALEALRAEMSAEVERLTAQSSGLGAGLAAQAEIAETKKVLDDAFEELKMVKKENESLSQKVNSLVKVSALDLAHS